MLAHKGHNRCVLHCFAGLDKVQHVATTEAVLEEGVRPRASRAAADHDRNAVSQLVSLVHIVCGQAEDALGPCLLEHLPQLTPRVRVHAGSGFVQEEDAGITQKRHRDIQLPLHAARKRRGRSLPLEIQLDLLQDLVTRAHGDVKGEPHQGAEEVDVLLHGQCLPEHIVLHAEAHLAPHHGALLRQPVPEHANLSCSLCQHPG
mmetsp:Transcript_118809/g.379003  ORF Transcript_118809/g.379003 Transcript_118809/m.379003 type:complete len:203 (+) Transcript_118809:3197-3805(+)